MMKQTFAWSLVVLLAFAGVLVSGSLHSPPQALAANNIGGRYTATIVACLQKVAVGANMRTVADSGVAPGNNGNNNGVTTAHELHQCVVASAQLPKFDGPASQRMPQEWPPGGAANTRITGGGGKYRGVFVGTDVKAGGPDTGAALDPCNLRAPLVAQGWVAANITTLGPNNPNCPSNNAATRNNITTAVDAAKTAAVTTPGEFVFYFAGHTTATLPRRLIVNDGTISGAQLATRLSGFPKGTTITVIIDACKSAGILNDMKANGVTYANGSSVGAAGNLSILTASDKVTNVGGLPKAGGGPAPREVDRCFAMVGGIVVDPETSALQLQSDSSSSSDAWLLTGMAIATASAFALGGSAWYVRRRRM